MLIPHRKMSVEAIIHPQIVSTKDTSIVLNWENVFPPLPDDSHLFRGIEASLVKKPEEDRVYDLRMQIGLDEWRCIYWGRKTEQTITNLAPCTCYNFKIKLIDLKNEKLESHWLEFKAATNIEQFHVHHLSRAIKYSKLATIRKILASRYYLLETPNIQDKTPLMQATEHNNLHVVIFLCNSGAKIDSQSTITKRTALMIALFYGFIDIAKYLIEKNSNINLKDVNDRTALNYAIDGNNLEAVKFVIQRGAMINSRDNKGWTPLLRAVILEAQDDIIKLLLKKGSDRSAVDKRGIDFSKHLQMTNRLHLLN